MATDFRALAETIHLQIYTRVNIAMYDAEGSASWPADPMVGALEVRMSVEELKQLAGLQRMRKHYSNGKGGFFPRLIDELNKFHGLHAKEDIKCNKGALVITYIPDIPKDKQLIWSSLTEKNSEDMIKNKAAIEGGIEDTDDYRYQAELTDVKFREWDDQDERINN